ncbi:hypothetical protein L1887_50838 [Cichorium endivia]|nr:hypothetical protein L1887_50838 [Cichorium endivia]
MNASAIRHEIDPDADARVHVIRPRWAGRGGEGRVLAWGARCTRDHARRPAAAAAAAAAAASQNPTRSRFRIFSPAQRIQKASSFFGGKGERGSAEALRSTDDLTVRPTDGLTDGWEQSTAQHSTAHSSNAFSRATLPAPTTLCRRSPALASLGLLGRVFDSSVAARTHRSQSPKLQPHSALSTQHSALSSTLHAIRPRYRLSRTLSRAAQI